jgi:hypothetical protein
MSNLSSFQKAFIDARNYFNKDEKYTTTVEVDNVETGGLNVTILALVCLMLVHNGNLEMSPNINDLQDYDLYNLSQSDYDKFLPYITYVLYRPDKKDGRKARGKKPKKTDPSIIASYTATFINYLFIAKIKDVTVYIPNNS